MISKDTPSIPAADWKTLVSAKRRSHPPSKKSDGFRGRHQLVKQRQPLGGCFRTLVSDAGKIAAGAIEARHETELDGIGARYKNDRNCCSRSFSRCDRWRSIGKDNRNATTG
jgi:hypothetical protein